MDRQYNTYGWSIIGIVTSRHLLAEGFLLSRKARVLPSATKERASPKLPSPWPPPHPTMAMSINWLWDTTDTIPHGRSITKMIDRTISIDATVTEKPCSTQYLWYDVLTRTSCQRAHVRSHTSTQLYRPEKIYVLSSRHHRRYMCASCAIDRMGQWRTP